MLCKIIIGIIAINIILMASKFDFSNFHLNKETVTLLVAMIVFLYVLYIQNNRKLEGFEPEDTVNVGLAKMYDDYDYYWNEGIRNPNLEVPENLLVRGDGRIGHNMLIDGNSVVAGTLDIGGNSIARKSMEIGGNLDVMSNLGVMHDAHVANELAVGGNAHVDGNLYIGQNAVVKDNLRVLTSVGSGLPSAKEIDIADSGWGEIITANCPQNHFMCGLKVRHENTTDSKKDDTGVNGLWLNCCSFS